MIAFLLNIVPLGRIAAMPDFLALVLVFWNVHEARRVGVGIAFAFGLLMDVHSGAVLGQHALAYTLLSFFAVTIQRRLLWFTVPSQAVQILPLFLAAQAVSLIVRMPGRRHVPGLGTDPRTGVPSRALAGGDVAVARAAAPRALTPTRTDRFDDAPTLTSVAGLPPFAVPRGGAAGRGAARRRRVLHP